MNDDTISRRAAIDAFMTATSDGDKAEWCRWVLKQLPPAQPERKNAYLINPNPYGKCSNCGQLIDIRDEYNYCPNCGADMREDTDDKS